MGFDFLQAIQVCIDQSLSVECVFAAKFWLTFSKSAQKLLGGPSGFLHNYARAQEMKTKRAENTHSRITRLQH